MEKLVRCEFQCYGFCKGRVLIKGRVVCFFLLRFVFFGEMPKVVSFVHDHNFAIAA